MSRNMTDVRGKTSEERALILHAKQGDAKAMETLLSVHMPLLRMLAARLCTYAPFAREDLVQAGCIGMMEAARRFDASTGVCFSTYAVPWALGEMRRTKRRLQEGIQAAQRGAEILRRQETLCAGLGRQPTLAELADACGESPEKIAMSLEAGRPPRSLSADTALARTLCGADEPDAEGIDLRIALGKLEQEERMVITLRYYRDKTQAQTASLMKKSQTQVSRIERRALDRLKALLA